MKYTIKFKAHNQDNLNFIPFTLGDDMPSHLDYDEVLARSIKEGYIKDDGEIKTLVDGSDYVQPYFTSLSAAEDCEASLNGAVEFDVETYVYELF